MGLLRSLRCSSGHNNKTSHVFVFQLKIVLLSQTFLFLLEDVLNVTLLRCLRWQTRHNSTIYSRTEDASGIYFPDDSNGICIFFIFDPGKLNCIVWNCIVRMDAKFPWQ